MLGLQVVLLSVFCILIGAEAAAPGVSKSVITAAAEVTLSVKDHTYARLCARVQRNGGACFQR